MALGQNNIKENPLRKIIADFHSRPHISPSRKEHRTANTATTTTNSSIPHQFQCRNVNNNNKHIPLNGRCNQIEWQINADTSSITAYLLDLLSPTPIRHTARSLSSMIAASDRLQIDTYVRSLITFRYNQFAVIWLIHYSDTLCTRMCHHSSEFIEIFH